MRYYYLEPEVAGGFGPETVMDQNPGLPMVRSLHHVFDGWLGDEILETTPCFIVTERLARSIEEHGLTGVTFDTVRIGRSDTFDELYPNRELPSFAWLKVCGERSADDFFMAEDGRLVVSERACSVLTPVADHALVTDFREC